MRLSRTITVADYVKKLKATSSVWIKEGTPHPAPRTPHSAFHNLKS